MLKTLTLMLSYLDSHGAWQGGSWLHVGTDQPFKSISIGGANQVWAIARDGEVFYRGSVSPQNPAGQRAKGQQKKKMNGKVTNTALTCLTKCP